MTSARALPATAQASNAAAAHLAGLLSADHPGWESLAAMAVYTMTLPGRTRHVPWSVDGRRVWNAPLRPSHSAEVDDL
jgi:hypothetical protein